MNQIIKEDTENILSRPYIEWSRFDGSVILVTGATGLIGKTICFALLAYAETAENPPKIIALVRNLEKAKRVFADYADSPRLEIAVSDIRDFQGCDLRPDYIIHTAGETSSLAFVSRPVETIMTAVRGTENLLRFAAESDVRGFIYLSTMEVYGAPHDDTLISENSGTNIDPMEIRSSYPESKRLCETLCAAYGREYNIPVKVLRLTQTFGPGVSYDDGRVFAEFARCAAEQRDIVLRSKGETKRMYLYTADAAAAVLLVLLQGDNGTAYNAANENTYCTILEMAEYAAKHCGSRPVSVTFSPDDAGKYGYAPVLHLNLDVSRLQSLGWKAEYDLPQMFQRMISTMQES